MSASKRSKSQMEREIGEVTSGGSALYYPGGSGGGGSRRGRGASGAVVLPHTLTSRSCSLCTRYHTTAEHDRHSGSKAKSKAMPKANREPKKTEKTKAKAKTKILTANDLRPGVRFRYNGHPVEILRDLERRKDRFGLELDSWWSRRIDTDDEGYVNLGPGGVLRVEPLASVPWSPAPSVKAPRGDFAFDLRKSLDTPRAPLNVVDAVQVVLKAIRNMPRSGRYGLRNVFISELHDRVAGKIGMSLNQFKRWLVELNRAGILILVRADMVDDMNPDQVERSEINDLGASFHFVIDQGAT